MPWRLIVFILIFGIFLAFVTFNLENRCDIGFGFTVLEDIPVFLTVFISFSLGLICAFPLVMYIKRSRKEKLIKGIKSKPETSPLEYAAVAAADEKIKQDAATARERFFSKRRGGKK